MKIIKKPMIVDFIVVEPYGEFELLKVIDFLEEHFISNSTISQKFIDDNYDFIQWLMSIDVVKRSEKNNDFFVTTKASNLLKEIYNLDETK